MSISTLNKKTKTLYNNISVNKPFSLNGGFRNQGYIGQTSFSRSLPNNIKNNGKGCSCQNDSNIIKVSSINYTGLLSTKYKWIRRGFPYTTIKPDQNKKISHTDLINKKKMDVVKCIETSKLNTNYTNISCNSGLPNSQKPRIQCISFENIKHKYLSQSQNIENNLYNKCNKFTNPSTIMQHTPFACNNLR
jgi:hypothetical protein